MRSHSQIRKIKNRRHQILLAIKGVKKRKHKNLVSLGTINIDDSCPILYSRKYANTRAVYNTGREVRILDPQTGQEICLQLLMEYSSLFPGRTLNIKEEILHFSREMLIKMVLVLGRNYGMCKISDMKDKPFFSYLSRPYEKRMEQIKKYIVRNNTSPEKVSYASHRTFLEFLKLVFGINPELCKAKYEDYIAEVKLFDLLLAINEQKVTCYKASEKQPHNFARTMYVNLYATNEFTNSNTTLDISEQMYYARTFFEFITSRCEYADIYNAFLEHFQIEKWEEYYCTVVMLSVMVCKNGEGTINLEHHDPDYLLNKNVLQKISIEEDSYIEIDDELGDENRDFVIFRSCPLIKQKNGDYMLYNKQLVIGRLYNSIYFDLLRCNLRYKDKNFNQFYKEIFVEKYLFDHAMVECLRDRKNDVCFPSLENVSKKDFVDQKEEMNQPDFYFREANNAFIFECKAIKLSGNLKANANVDDIIDELENKLWIKRWKKDGATKRSVNPKAEGVGQLVNHIERLENNDFLWDNVSSNKIACYYPVLVLESSEIVRTPLSTITNEWYQKQLNDVRNVDKSKCKPLIVMTIKTLFLYDHLFRENGFKYFFDKFITKHKRETKDSLFAMSEFNDFDNWMRTNFESNKKSYYMDTIEILRKK